MSHQTHLHVQHSWVFSINSFQYLYWVANEMHHTNSFTRSPSCLSCQMLLLLGGLRLGIGYQLKATFLSIFFFPAFLKYKYQPRLIGKICLWRHFSKIILHWFLHVLRHFQNEILSVATKGIQFCLKQITYHQRWKVANYIYPRYCNWVALLCT